MTKPVFEQSNGQQDMMAFVMPYSMQMEDVPQPNNKDVHLKETDDGEQFAVYMYGGWATHERNEEAYENLQKWLAETEYDEEQSPIFAQFESPFVPGFFRHNEVMLQLN